MKSQRYLFMSPAIFNHTMESLILLTRLLKIPYYNVAMSVKEIDVFRIDDSGRGAALFDTYKNPCATARSHCQHDYRATDAERNCFPTPEPN